MATRPFEVAIIGGGLCGLALAVALQYRDVPFHLYESRSSFTEIGAGINLGLNAIRAFDCIDPALGAAVRQMCAQNPPPNEDVWMQFRFGAPTGSHKDYDLIGELKAPPVGNMTARRNELLELLAARCPEKNVSFNKKFSHFDQSGSDVVIHFTDQSQACASVVIACDGVHSSVRKALLGAEHEAASPRFTGVALYRAVLPVEQMETVFGKMDARLGQLIFGPRGYLVKYAVTGGEHVSMGFCHYTHGDWQHKEWNIPHQRAEMLEYYQHWGDTIHKLMDIVPDPSSWAIFAHSIQPEKLFDNRVCLIGDAAHTMPAHQGAGSGQATEDAYFMAEMLSSIDRGKPDATAVNAAMEAYDRVRQPHAQRVLKMGLEVGFLQDFWKPNIQQSDIETFKQQAYERWHSIWDYDIRGEVARAQDLMQELLSSER